MLYFLSGSAGKDCDKTFVEEVNLNVGSGF